ncbi:phage tail protein [Gracilibacillus timonensis]|uniref:phage tail protein n=1 Tax=Gracilibacillus timonensis TaxID=1816696 RepID=UPI0008249279|nr:hypothetical protein [Gracilibacillus timonensis]
MQDKYNIRFRISAIDNFSKNMKKLERQMDSVERKARSLESLKPISFETKGAEKAVSELKAVEEQAEKINNYVPVRVEATGTGKALNQLTQANRTARQVPAVVHTHLLITGYKDYMNKMGKVATNLRNFDEIMRGMASGGMFTALPALVPIIGVAAGGLGAIASAFSSAALGAGAFSAVAIPAIGGVVKANEDLKEAQEAVDNASNEEERAEALKELTQLQDGYTAKQLETVGAMREFSSFYKQLSKQFENPILDIFMGGLTATKTLLELSKPAIEGVTTAMQNLINKFNANLEAEDIRTFFNWLGETAGPRLETLTTAVGNFAVGLLNMLVAFNPLAESFSQGFLNMSERFREWSAALSESEAFQNFIAFVQEHTPTVLSLIGNIATTLINLGIAMEPVAVKVLELADKFFAWTSQLLENHKWIGQVIGVAISLVGIIKLVAPIVTAVSSAFKVLAPFLKKAWSWIGKLGNIFVKIFPKIAMFGTRIASLTNPIGIAINIIIALASIVISNWDTIWSWTKDIFSKVSGWIKKKWQQAKAAFDIVSTIVSTAVRKFQELVDTVKEKMGNVKSKIEEIWDNVLDFLGGGFDDMKEIGGNIITGLIDGIKGMASDAVNAVGDVVNDAIGWAENLLNINSPSKVFMAMGESTGEGFVKGIDRMAGKVKGATGNMAKDAIKGFKPPQVALSSPGYAESPDTFKKRQQQTDRSEMQGIRAELQATNGWLSQIYAVGKDGQVIELDRREVGRTITSEVTREQRISARRLRERSAL